MSTPQVTDAARPDDVTRGPGPVVPNWLHLHNNTVVNRTASNRDLKFHHEGTNLDDKISRDGVGHIRGNIDWLEQNGYRFRFAEPIGTISRQVVVVSTIEPQEPGKAGAPTLELSISSIARLRLPPKTYVTLPGEPILRTDNTDDKVDPAPGVSLSTEPLADVVFTSSLSSSLSNLSLGDEDNIAEQQATLDTYKRALDTLLYRHEVTAVRIGSFISYPISIGPLTITIAFDTSTGEGSVTASVIGISLGSAKFSLTKGATIGVDVWLAKASVRVWVQDSGVWLEAHASVRFDGSVDFGPKELFHF
jgi:hypothetical protein